MKKSLVLLSLACALLYFSCGDFLLHDDFRGDDWFYLENKGAIMPVWVTGNTQSGVFIIWLHGGPGASSFPGGAISPFTDLQEDYAIVWWDQRFSGLSQGNACKDSLTMEQFVEDLEKLVVLIRHKYSNPTLFLMGTSWGSSLGTAFLTNPANQTYISGWISLAGPHSYPEVGRHQKEWVLPRAAEQIKLGNDVEHWKKEIEWFNSNPDISSHSSGNMLRLWENVIKLHGDILDPSKQLEIPFSWHFNSPLSFSYYFNLLFMRTNNGLAWLDNVNLSQDMHKITLPSLLLFGRHDGVVPAAIGYEAYALLGSQNKYLYFFENSAHELIFEESELFLARVRVFIKKYR